MIYSDASLHPIAQPLTIFLVGATGDLSRNKILKAIYALFIQDLLPEQFSLVGIARADYSPAEFQVFAQNLIQPNNLEQWQRFAQNLHFVSGDVTQLETFNRLKTWHDQRQVCGNHLWYIATLPSLYIATVRNLKSSGFSTNTCGWTKCLLEKPFGTDTATAKALDVELLSTFREEQIFRIDHFLAKETVQNILIFRFANGLFENVWHRDFIDHIQVHSTETLGVSGREIFYDQTGALRDVVQNHVLNVLATTLMEPPTTLQAGDIRTKRTELLAALQPLTPATIRNQVAFGQYTTGLLGSETVSGYQSEKDFLSQSRTETAVALKCFVDSPRWQGVPIYIRAGKRLKEAVTEISIQFKQTKNAMFSTAGLLEQPNVLTLRIGPREGFEMKLYVKKPGLQLGMQTVPVQFYYQQSFAEHLVEAYVKLLYDAIVGDPTLFPDARAIELAWNFIQPVLEHKAEPSFEPDPYPAGSHGPASFDQLIKADGRQWYTSSIGLS